MPPPKYNPAKPHCFLTHCSLNPEASCTNVSEETPYNWQPKLACRHPAHHKELLERDGTRTSRPAKPSHNLNNAGPIVRCLKGLPVMAGCDTAWDQTWAPCVDIWPKPTGGPSLCGCFHLEHLHPLKEHRPEPQLRHLGLAPAWPLPGPLSPCKSWRPRHG